MTVRAKFKVTRTGQVQYGSTPPKVLYDVEMTPVYSNDPGSENKAFWDATPTGSFKMTSILPDAFEVGAEYYLDITKAEPVVAP